MAYIIYKKRGNAIVKNGQVIKWPATMAMFRRMLPPGPVLKKNASAPITIGEYSYLQPVSSEMPVADVIQEIEPIFIDGILTRQWEGRNATQNEIDGYRAKRLSELSAAFDEKSKRPVVDTGLGFTVHGGYDDVQDFKIGKELGANTFVIGTDNQSHAVTTEQFDAIILAIKTNGLALKQNKWALRAQINAATTLDELAAVDINAGWPS